MDVAEGSGEQVLALVGAERVDGLLEVLDRGVELVVDGVLDAVLFTADDADLDLEDDLRGLGGSEEFLRDLEVLVDRDGRAVHMCDWNSGFCPLFTRSCEIAMSGRTKPSSLSFGQWSVCRAIVTSYFSATTWANSASATAPVTMSFTPRPEPNSRHRSRTG